jgi:hypothetical protein
LEDRGAGGERWPGWEGDVQRAALRYVHAFAGAGEGSVQGACGGVAGTLGGHAMKRQFQVIQFMQDGSEERYEVAARNYSTCWRNRVQWAKGLERTRSIVVHELTADTEGGK